MIPSMYRVGERMCVHIRVCMSTVTERIGNQEQVSDTM